MKIEKLNENKIRITLNMNDLKEKNIDFHSFMSNSLDSQSLFLDMLAQAEEEVGFVTKDYKIMIEALATSEGDFILTVTRFVPDTEKDNLKRKKVKTSRKFTKLNKEVSIYCFKTFDDFTDYCTSLDEGLFEDLKKSFANSILYSYNSNYYLLLKDISASPTLINKFSSDIAEFATTVHNPKLFSKKLSEYGKIIMKKNAIKLCKKHFA